MAAAWLLTALALVGVLVGASLHASRSLSTRTAAVGAGLLLGIALFWLVPEISANVGWPLACTLTLLIAVGIFGLDRLLMHTGHSPRHGVIAPLLVATAVHSFLDGWSIRALSVHPLASVAVGIALALHKIPEGLALGWVTRKSIERQPVALTAASLVELVTVLGAWVEPHATRSGVQLFGAWWTAFVLAVVAGAFLFFGFHAVIHERTRPHL